MESLSDVLLLTSKELKSFTDDSEVLEKPILVREAFEQLRSLSKYVQRLKSTYRGLKRARLDYHLGPAKVDVNAIRLGMRAAEIVSTNSLEIPDLAFSLMPKMTVSSRFSLLKRMVERIRTVSSSGSTHDAAKIRAKLSFNILTGAGVPTRYV